MTWECAVCGCAWDDHGLDGCDDTLARPVCREDPRLTDVFDLAACSGVTIHRRMPTEAECEAHRISWAPADTDACSTDRVVWWVPEPGEREVPEWMRLLHEVGHAATGGPQGRDRTPAIGSEQDANAFELAACCAIWGVFSAETRQCIRWGIEGDWSLLQVRQTWEHWFAWGEPPRWLVRGTPG